MRKIPCHNLFKDLHPMAVLGIVRCCVGGLNVNSSLFKEVKWAFV